jgi:nitroreductase
MTVVEGLKRIGCVSEFEERDISGAELAVIAKAAAWAPSAANAQPWEIVAVRDRERKVDLVRTLLDSHLRPRLGGDERRDWLAQAPVVLVVCLDRLRAKARYGEIGENLFGIQDTGAAIQNMRLVALEQGIKSCLVREFDHQKLAQLLELPGHVEPLIMIALGYSTAEAAQLPLLPLEDFLHQEQW